MKFDKLYQKLTEDLNNSTIVDPSVTVLNTSDAIQRSNLANDPQNRGKVDKLKQMQTKTIDNTSTLLQRMNDHLQKLTGSFQILS